MKLTDFQMKNLKPKPERYEVWEEKTGFGVRVTPKGKKTFIYMYRFGGKARRLTLGAYPKISLAEAHRKYAEAKEKVESGIDPGVIVVAERKEERKAPTVANLASKYIEEWAMPRKRSWKTDKRILEKDILPEWGQRKVKDVTRSDVKNLLRKVLYQVAV